MVCVVPKVAAGGSSAITPSLLASRSGSIVAPAYIHLDASGTTSSDSSITSAANGGAFRNILHNFVVIDNATGFPAALGNHTPTGLPRNTQTGGPICAFVIDVPGSYTIIDTMSHPGTANASASVTMIAVTDPGSVYTGTNTVIVGTAGPVTGAPAGCAYSASTSTSITSSKRWLLLTGQSYSPGGFGICTGVRVDRIDSSGVIGVSASGAAPIITNGVQIGGNVSTTNDNAVSNCDIRAGMQAYTGQHNVFHRCAGRLAGGAQFVQTNEDGWDKQKYTCFSELDLDMTGSTNIGQAGGNGNYCMFIGFAQWVAIIGCTTSLSGFHDIRIPHAYKVFIGHNQLKGLQPGNPGGFHALKINGGGTGTSPGGSSSSWDEVSGGSTGFASEKIVVANNLLGNAASNNAWTVEFAPQNDDLGGAVEGITDGISENNQFTRGTGGSPVDLQQGGRRMTRRGNTSTNSSVIYGTSCNSTNIPSGWDGAYFPS